MARVTRAAAAKAAKAIVNLDIGHEDAQMSEGDSEAHEEASGNESSQFISQLEVIIVLNLY